MQRITPCLWFNDNAEEAVNFYIDVFSSVGLKDSRITKLARYDEEGAKVSGQKKGSVMTIGFELGGQAFLALNGGPVFTFSPAVSFIANCDTQKEIDELWEKLSEGGEKQQCGWLKDRYGVSWQIVPTVLGELFQDKYPDKSQKVMKALLQMGKLDIKRLEEAYR